MRVKINCLNRYAIYADGGIAQNKIITSKTDCDDMVPLDNCTATYLVYASASNKPTSSHGYTLIAQNVSLTSGSANVFVTQTALLRWNVASVTPTCYIRFAYGSEDSLTWSDWAQL